MTGEEQTFRALTLLFATCEQALEELEGLSPPERETTQCVAPLRDHLYAVLSARFGARLSAGASLAHARRRL